MLKHTAPFFFRAAALCALLCLLTACSTVLSGNWLSYQEYPFKAIVKYSRAAADTPDSPVYLDNVSVSVVMTAPEQGVVEFISPSTLEGFKFHIAPDGITLSYGDITVPFEPPHSSAGADAVYLVRLFSLKKEQLASVEIPRPGLTDVMTLNIATFDAEFGTVDVYLSAETSLPVRIESETGWRKLIMEISDFTSYTGGG